MYQSRLHATNGIVSIAVDSLNGEILELTRESTWDNLAKNHVRKTWSLMDGIVHLPEGALRFHVPRYADICADGQLRPSIDVVQSAGSAEIKLTYPALVANEKKIDIGAVITISLPENDCRTRWRLTLDNRTDGEIDQVCFPALDGLWLGETWEDDILVLPRFAGWQVVNPVRKLAAQPPVIHWKWQEYLYAYNMGELNGTKDDRGAYVAELPYTGAASMMWMDLFDKGEGTGLYMTCRNENLIMKGLRVESFGEAYPGLGMAIVHKPCLKKGCWHSEECVVALHEGDWHWGADDYRAWFSSLNRPAPGAHRPKWFEESAGLVAHYDFQYQLGGIVHTFKDIPRLYDEAERMGFSHLLLSGWNEDGFDYGFPHYAPNHKLGTEQELKDALAQVRAKGGHVAFYVNSRLCNTAFADQRERIQESAIMQRDGSLHIEKYGAANVQFAMLCINDTKWRGDLAETVRYLTQTIGADSIYLDELAMAPSEKCYHPGHAEHENNPIAWNQGYEKLLATLRAGYGPEGMALIYEGCNDIYGPYASGQLITTLGGPFVGRLPEVYKYTFPDQILADMMNPRRNSAMRPEHVARHSTEFLHKAFVIGCYLWCYDLEWDNTWRRDPQQYARLQKIAALRKAWLKRYGQGRFTDIVGLESAPEGQLIKRFTLPDGALLACAAEQGLRGCAAVAWESDSLPRAEAITLENSEAPRPISCRFDTVNGKRCVLVDLPSAEAAVIALLRAQ